MALLKATPRGAGTGKDPAGRKRNSIGRRKESDHKKAGRLQAIGFETMTARIGEDLRKEVLKTAPAQGRYCLTVDVLIENGRIQIGKAHPAPNSSEKASTARTAEFDPFEAGRKAVADLQTAEGGSWTGAELAARHGLTPANLHKRRAEYRIVSWQDAKSQFHYPKWQFNEAGRLLPGLQAVLQTFRSADDWRVMRYFLGRRSQLAERTPLEVLRAGEVEGVVAHARRHAEENTW